MVKVEGLRYRKPMNNPIHRGSRPRKYTREEVDGMIIERDVEVPTRFGYNVYIDIFRPQNEVPSAPLIAWTPYGKHDPSPLATIYPDADVKQEWISKYTSFESPDPLYWTKHGYVIIVADIPGTWDANTESAYMDPIEAEAFYDLIEWAGVQSWSNGKVGLSGVSYLTIMQWRVAELNPPHLAAINPWEGWTDTYREVVYHGGIPETYFWEYIQTRWGASTQLIEDLWRETQEHPFFDSFWERKASKLEKIKVPAYVTASWTDHGLHTRGTLEGFKKINSEQKWLEIHGRKKWHWYYEPSSVERQRVFFDHFLLGKDNELKEWPKVNYELREAANKGEFIKATSWPLPNTSYEKLYLDAASMKLIDEKPQNESSVRYDSLEDIEAVNFIYEFKENTDLVGHMKLKLFIEAEESDDIDIFVAIEKLDKDDNFVGFCHFAIFFEGPTALGWLRVSHRELDKDESTEFQPVLKHKRILKIEPLEITEVEIEILPSGTKFEEGEKLRLVIKGRDIYNYPKPLLLHRHEDSVNNGHNIIHTGGKYGSYLLVPKLK